MKAVKAEYTLVLIDKKISSFLVININVHVMFLRLKIQVKEKQNLLQTRTQLK